MPVEFLPFSEDEFDEELVVVPLNSVDLFWFSVVFPVFVSLAPEMYTMWVETEVAPFSVCPVFF